MRQIIFWSFLFLFCFSAFGQEEDSRLKGLEIDIDSLMNKCQTVGVSISVVENGKILYSKGFGYRNLAEKLPVTPNTIFPIGSVTKSITSSLIGVYVGQSKLETKDKPSKYIPYLRFSTDEMNNLITVEDLLTHRSGIGNTDATHVFFPTDDIREHIGRLSHIKPSSQVRERFDYSNMGYAILGEITAQISGKTWRENIEEEIFNPLEMHHSNCTLEELQSSNNFSLGYSLYNQKPVKVEYEDQHESYASGAINSTTNDLTKWVMMLLDGGLYKDKQIIPKAYLENSFSEHNIIRGSFGYERKYNLLADTYGYGWFVHQYKNMYRVNHEGNVSGFTSSINLYPYKKIGIIILTNQGSSNLLTKSINDIIINRLLGKERKPWQDYEIRIGESIVPQTNFPALKADKLPSHPLSEYNGKYFSKSYGELEVFQEGRNLMIQFPAFKMYLEHFGYNTFINKVVDTHHQNTPSFYINFYPNNEGRINRLTIEFSEEPEIFVKLK